MASHFRIISFIFLLIGTPSFLSAQIQVKGLVQNANDLSMVKEAIISVYSNDSIPQLLNQTISDDSGRFALSMQKGFYWLQIGVEAQIWYEQSLDVITDTDLGIIAITLNQADELQEFVVKGNRSSVKLENGKLKYTPIIESAGNAFDILKTAPTIFADENNIQIIGKGTPIIMINGKRERMNIEQVIEYLKTLPADQVASIEIVRTPGAEQDADNMNGSINIVLKGNKEKGLLGSAYARYSQNTFASYSSGFSLNGNNGKWQYNLNTSLHNFKYLRKGWNELHYPEVLWKSYENQTNNNWNTFISGGLHYTIDKRQSIGINFNLNNNQFHKKEKNPTDIFDNQTNVKDSTLLTQSVNPESMWNYAASLNYVYKIDSIGTTLRIDAEHFEQSYDRNQAFTNYRMNAKNEPLSQSNMMESGNLQRMRITAANIAMEIPWKKFLFSLGTKATWIDNSNQTSFYESIDEQKVPDPTRFDHFEYYEQIYAAYGKASLNLEKWSFTAGLRAEQTYTKGLSKVYQIENKNQYFQWFPSANISYNHSSNHIYSLSYARNIERPFFAQVNPFKWYHNQYAFTHGNPFLQPAFSNSFDFTYIFKQRWTLVANYNRWDQTASEITIPNQDNYTSETIVDNFVNSNNYYAGIIYQRNLWNRWLIYPQIGIHRAQIMVSKYDIESSQTTYISASMYQQITLNKRKTLFLDLNTYYYAPRNYAYMNFKTLWSQSINVTYNAMDKKWQFAAGVNDVFKTSAMRYTSVVNGIARIREVYNDQQNCYVSLRYNFNSGKVKQAAQKSDFNDDVIRRAN